MDFEQPRTDPIEAISKEMPPQQDAEGEMIPSFSEWIDTLSLRPSAESSPELLGCLKSIYHFGIYNRPKPSKDPFADYIAEQEKMIRSEKEKSDAASQAISAGSPSWSHIEGTTYFNASSGELFDIGDQYASVKYLERKLEIARSLQDKR